VILQDRLPSSFSTGKVDQNGELHWTYEPGTNDPDAQLLAWSACSTSIVDAFRAVDLVDEGDPISGEIWDLADAKALVEAALRRADILVDDYLAPRCCALHAVIVNGELAGVKYLVAE